MAEDARDELSGPPAPQPVEYGQTPPKPASRLALSPAMRKRIILGLVMIGAMIGLFVLDWWLGARQWPADKVAWQAIWSTKGVVLAIVVLVLTIVGFLELARLARPAGTEVLKASGLVGVIVIATLPVLRNLLPHADYGANGPLMYLGILAALAFVEQMIRHRTQQAFARIGATTLAILYLGVGGAMFLAIRVAWGVPALVLFLAAVKFTDIGAYFAGSFFGKHKLIPWLSPGKSWEGLGGGLLLAVVATVLLRLALGVNMSLLSAVIFGAAMALAGQLADLSESLLKRSASVKDSGAIVPGFGGVLDLADSVLLSAPVAFLLMAWMIR